MQALEHGMEPPGASDKQGIPAQDPTGDFLIRDFTENWPLTTHVFSRYQYSMNMLLATGIFMTRCIAKFLDC